MQSRGLGGNRVNFLIHHIIVNFGAEFIEKLNIEYPFLVGVMVGWPCAV